MQSLKLHKTRESLRSSILGFIRHGQEDLNNTRRSWRLYQLLLEPYLMPPASDYPLAGCSQAEPAYVLSDTFYVTIQPILEKESDFESENLLI
jgi:hypothetical protein